VERRGEQGDEEVMERRLDVKGVRNSGDVVR
jgi:hypothetical protein